MAELLDEEIALLVQKGETYWFSSLVERYEAKILRYAKRFLYGHNDIEDHVQEVFVKAYINIQSFDSRRKFSPWLYRIAHNQFVNSLAKKTREQIVFFDSDTLFPHPVYEDGPSENPDGLLKKALDTCLDKIDEKYREPLVLYYYEEMDYREISDILRIPVSTVGVRLKRGKSILKEIFNKKHPEYEQ